jgi:S-adenosylmethionine-dependent methyltransferase
MTFQDDRNFDKLIHRFERVVYDTAKGSWRLKLIQEDLKTLRENPTPLMVWDAGCGFGQISLWLAEQGHDLVLCDVSGLMLSKAQANFAKAGLTAQFHHAAIQQIAPQLPQFDLALFHATLEWLGNPPAALNQVADKVKPGGYLSLLYYNRNAMIYKNALKAGWRLQHLLEDNYLGKGNKLTPPNPQYPHEIQEQLRHLGFTINSQTGILVFHDYLADDIRNASNEEELFALEYRYCRIPTFRDMGRYIHLLARRDTSDVDC